MCPGTPLLCTRPTISIKFTCFLELLGYSYLNPIPNSISVGPNAMPMEENSGELPLKERWSACAVEEHEFRSEGKAEPGVLILGLLLIRFMASSRL